MMKRYDIRGMMEWHPVFRVGRSRIKVAFTGGHLCGGGCTPASFETSDPVLQKVIEESEAFRSGLIVIGMEVPSDEAPSAKRSRIPPAVPSAKPKPEDPSGACVFEYREIEDIIDFLHYEKGVALERMLDDESIFREADLLGVTLRKKTK